MKKMESYEDDDVDFDKDSDPEAQKVYRRDLSEITRTPSVKRSTKSTARPKKAAKRAVDSSGDSYDRKENRRAMMSGFGVPSRNEPVDDSREFRRLPEAKTKRSMSDTAGEFNYKKGGSVGSASKRADGIAQRGKTRGKMI
jgi:hypothetical protein